MRSTVQGNTRQSGLHLVDEVDYAVCLGMDPLGGSNCGKFEEKRIIGLKVGGTTVPLLFFDALNFEQKASGLEGLRILGTDLTAQCC